MSIVSTSLEWRRDESRISVVPDILEFVKYFLVKTHETVAVTKSRATSRFRVELYVKPYAKALSR